MNLTKPQINARECSEHNKREARANFPFDSALETGHFKRPFRKNLPEKINSTTKIRESRCLFDSDLEAVHLIAVLSKLCAV